LRRLQQRIVASIIPVMAQSIAHRFGDTASYIGEQTAQALLSMSVIDRRLHANEINDSKQFLALLRDNKLLSVDEYHKYVDLFNRRVDQNMDTNIVLDWAKKTPLKLWTHHRDNAQSPKFEITQQQHRLNQIVFTLSGLSLISYAFLYVLVSDQQAHMAELKLLNTMLGYFERPENLFRYVGKEPKISVEQKNILIHEFCRYVETFVQSGLLPVTIMQHVMNTGELITTTDKNILWSTIVDEITGIDTTIIDNYMYFSETTSVAKHVQTSLPLPNKPEQMQFSFTLKEKPDIQTIENITRVIEDDDERVLTASQLHDLTLDMYGVIDDSIGDAGTNVYVKNDKWHYLVETLLDLSVVTNDIIEDLIFAHVSSENSAEAYAYVTRHLQHAKKIVSTIVEPDTYPSVLPEISEANTFDIVKDMVKKVNQRLNKSLFMTYNQDYKNFTVYHALLSKGEERDLCKARQILQGLLRIESNGSTVNKKALVNYADLDSQIREILINHNYRLVMQVAYRYEIYVQHLEIMDLFQEGCIGLITAIDKFDVNRNGRISTYATWWIRQAISRAIQEYDRVIRLPVHFIESLQRLKKEQTKLTQTLMREPSNEELAQYLKTSVEDVKLLRYWNVRVSSINQPLPDENGNEIGDFIVDATDFVDEIVNSSLHDTILMVLKKLDTREQRILHLRFGLEDGRCWTYEEIGGEFKVTRERIRQIIDVALRKLHKSRDVRVLDGYR